MESPWDPCVAGMRPPSFSTMLSHCLEASWQKYSVPQGTAAGPSVSYAPSSWRSAWHVCIVATSGIKIILIVSQSKFSLNSWGFATIGNSQWTFPGVWRQSWKGHPKMRELSVSSVPAGIPKVTEQVVHYTRAHREGIWGLALSFLIRLHVQRGRSFLFAQKLAWRAGF